MRESDSQPVAPGVAMRGGVIHWVAVVGLLMAQLVGGVASARYDSVTFDELTHFTSGVSYWQHHDYRLDPENPPLIQLWSTLPLRFMDVPEIPTASDAWRRGDQWNVARDWFANSEAPQYLLWGRFQMLLLLIALTLSIYGVTRMLLGAGAGLLAMAVAAMWPTLLAHGRLVTSDVPMALFSLLALVSVAALLRRPGVLRYALAALACGGLAIVKFSAVLVLPAILLIAIADGVLAGGAGRVRRTARNFGLLAALAIAAWAAVWAAYGGRYTMFADDVAEIEKLPDDDARLAVRRYWVQMLNVAVERHNRVWTPWLVEQADAWRLLPEAYLYGFTYTLHSAQGRPAYLAGQYSDTGWWYYFPAAFALKTPLAIQALLLAGVLALVLRRGWVRGHVPLLAGIGAFVLIYGAMSLTSKLNIGERHLIPLYPAVCIACGAAATFATQAWGRVAGAGLVVWLAVGWIQAFPNYLSYGNELMGGPGRAHRWLADSNLDWGQGLNGLMEYASAHSDEPVRLAYFGSVDPARLRPTTPGNEAVRGRIEALPSYRPFEPAAELGAGLYVVSVTQLVGVYDRLLRPESWSDPELLRAFAAWRALAEQPLADSADQGARRAHAEARRTYAELRAKRLISRLRDRTPDFWVHPTLAAFRLTREEVEQLAQVAEMPR